jgi:hypothetical protein
MQHLKVSGAVVLYIGRTVSKGKVKYTLQTLPDLLNLKLRDFIQLEI